MTPSEEQAPPSGPDETPEQAAEAEAEAPVHRLHPFTLLFEALAVGRRFLVPAILGGLVAGGGEVSAVVYWGIAFLSVPAFARAGVKYATFRYRVRGDELAYESGLLHRHRRLIPLDRVQNIHTRQGALQRLFRVAELRVETASGDAADATLAVLRVAEAHRLRDELLRRRRALARAAGGEGGEEPGLAPDDRTRILAHLRPGALALLGATSNRAGLIAAAIAGLLQIGLQLPGFGFLPDDPEVLVEELATALIPLVVVGLVLAILLVGWVLSIVTVTIGYHDFTLERTDGEIQKRYGLLGRRSETVLLRRVQTVRVEESVLRRPLGLAALRIESAGSELGQRQQGRVEAFLPLARAGEVPRLVREVFARADYEGLEVRPVHPRARLRAFIRYSVPVVLAAALLGALRGPGWVALLLLLPACWGAAVLHYRHLGYALTPHHVVTRAGFLNRITWVVPLHKIQTLHVTESPFQRRHGLATLVVDTAAGGGADAARAKDLAREDARALQHHLLGASLAALRRPEGALPDPGGDAIC